MDSKRRATESLKQPPVFQLVKLRPQRRWFERICGAFFCFFEGIGAMLGTATQNIAQTDKYDICW
jgi:hypothetical protein